MWYTDDPEFTRYGYYEVNGIKTFSKFEAWQHSNGNFNDIKFSYNNDVMDAVDWTTEPTEDIYQLYKQRAYEIREKYDYVVLMFSGGIDCSVALNAFINNGIHIDEVLTCTTASIEPKDSLFNMEVFNRAIPIGSSLKNTKFRLVDIVELMRNQYYDKFHLHNCHYYMNNTATNWNTAIRTYKLKEQIEDHMKLAREGKKICYVWGLDKPVIKLVDNHYALFFIDNGMDAAKMYCNRVLLKDYFENFYDEPFYISRTLPKLTVKQAHLLANRMNDIKPDDPRLISQDQLGNTGPVVIHHRFQYFRFLPRELVNGTLYPNENLSLFKNDKVKGSIIYSPRDNWWLNSGHSTTYMWETHLNKLVQNNKDYFFFKDGKLIQSNVCMGQHYKIAPCTHKQETQ